MAQNFAMLVQIYGGRSERKGPFSVTAADEDADKTPRPSAVSTVWINPSASA
jgi:hypothetical protein